MISFIFPLGKWMIWNYKNKTPNPLKKQKQTQTYKPYMESTPAQSSGNAFWSSVQEKCLSKSLNHIFSYCFKRHKLTQKGNSALSYGSEIYCLEVYKMLQPLPSWVETEDRGSWEMQVVLENELFQSSLLLISEPSSALLCCFSVTGLDQYSRSNTHCSAMQVWYTTNL